MFIENKLGEAQNPTSPGRWVAGLMGTPVIMVSSFNNIVNNIVTLWERDFKYNIGRGNK